MFSCKEIKPEPEEAEICLPVKPEPEEEAEICLPVNHHHLHIRCLHSHSNLGGAQEPTEPKLVIDCVKTECDSSPERIPDQTPPPRRTEEDGLDVTLRSQQNLPIKNEVKEGNITKFKHDPAERFDDFLEDFIKQKTKEEAVNLNQDEVLRLSECEVSGPRVCCTLMYKRIQIPNGDTNSTNGTRSEPKTIHDGTDESRSSTESEPCEIPQQSCKKDKTRRGKEQGTKDKKVEGDGQQKHFCHLCRRGYVHKFHLDVHMKTHTGEKKYHCQECGAAFYLNYQLREHTRVHSGTRPFACTECGKRFTRSGNLREHQRCHSGEKPHRCAECGSSFKSARALRRHQMIHTGDKPFACTCCGKGFLRPATLQKHMRIHTGERPFLCSECGKTFPYAHSHRMHMDKIHNIRNL